MPDKYKNKYRIESTRLKNWDYGSNAAYFVTICTRDRVCFFGDVIDGNMVLNEIGAIARDFWETIPRHFPFVILGAHVVMPNHVHGVLIIDKSAVEAPKLGASTTTSQKWKPGTLGVMINQYKRMVTIRARKISAEFAWQSRFHDHIIRNDASFQRISSYIVNNPMKWTEDQFR